MKMIEHLYQIAFQVKAKFSVNLNEPPYKKHHYKFSPGQYKRMIFY